MSTAAPPPAPPECRCAVCQRGGVLGNGGFSLSLAATNLRIERVIAAAAKAAKAKAAAAAEQVPVQFSGLADDINSIFVKTISDLLDKRVGKRESSQEGVREQLKMPGSVFHGKSITLTPDKTQPGKFYIQLEGNFKTARLFGKHHKRLQHDLTEAYPLYKIVVVPAFVIEGPLLKKISDLFEIPRSSKEGVLQQLEMLGSVFDGTIITITPHATNPKAFHIRLEGHPAAAQVFNEQRENLQKDLADVHPLAEITVESALVTEDPPLLIAFKPGCWSRLSERACAFIAAITCGVRRKSS